MSVGIETKDTIEMQIDWEQLFTDIKEKFSLSIDIDKLTDFCSKKEKEYVKILWDEEYEKYHIDNEGEIEIIEDDKDQT